MNYLDVYKLNDPNWINAPEWANWRSVDEDGTITWYENEPEPPGQDQWVWSNGLWNMDGWGMNDKTKLDVNDWDLSLQSRPKGE